MLFSDKVSPAVHEGTTSFWNRFGERRFTVLWVMPWAPRQIFSNHAARGGYVLNPSSVFTLRVADMIDVRKTGRFSAALVRLLLGLQPWTEEPSNSWLLSSSSLQSGWYRVTPWHAKLRGSYKYVVHVKDSFHWQCDLCFFPFPNEAQMQVSGSGTGTLTKARGLSVTYSIIKGYTGALFHLTVNFNP